MRLQVIFISAVLVACSSSEEPSVQNNNIEDISCSDLKKRVEVIIDVEPEKYEGQTVANTNPKRYQEALSELSIGLESCATDVNFLLLMSEVQMSLGENGKALDYAKAALSKDANNAFANYSVGNLLILMGSSVNGLDYLEKSVLLAPSNQNMKLGFCSSLELAKKYNKAVDICSQVISKGTQKGPALFIRGRSYEALNMKNKAQQDYDEAKQLGYDLSPYYSNQHFKGQ